MKRFNLLLSGAVLICCNSSLYAAAFTSCPSEAYLVQGSKQPYLYSVDLASGDYELLAKLDSTKSMNATAYNLHDDFIYSWSKDKSSLVKIHSDYTFETLSLTISHDSKSIYVGDISPTENVYYYYHPSLGIHAIPLDPSDSQYLVQSTITNQGVFSQAIYDLAINPNDGFAYSVSRTGELFKINLKLNNAASTPHTSLGNVGQTGTFGATYFDNNNNLYISNNSTGKIFRINVTASSPTAELFANGPKSSNNDGARCATSNILNTATATLDFGDAPDTYGTKFDNSGTTNGARHTVSNLYLGAKVEAETVAYIDPLSDGENQDQNDEDGVSFINTVDIKNTNLIEINSSGAGFVNAWVDWQQTGTFDSTDQILTDAAVTAGKNTLAFDAPTTTTGTGETWSRFRLSSSTGLQPTGGASDGEVEDYKINVINTGTTTSYPSSNGWVTLAYEDNWPEQGDYDMNDVVMKFRTSITNKDGEVTRIKLEGILDAAGGSYQHGFAVHLPDIAKSSVDESNIQFSINGITQTTSPLEAANSDTVFVISEQINDYIDVSESGCTYFRTETDCEMTADGVFEFSVNIPFKDGSLPAFSSFPKPPFDPFIFATPGTYHGDSFSTQPGRGLEIHLKNKKPTALFDTSYFNLGDDASNAANNLYFLTSKGMPWAIEIANEWFHPYERIDILKSYPKFQSFVTSNGASEKLWFSLENADTSNIYQQ